MVNDDSNKNDLKFRIITTAIAVLILIIIISVGISLNKTSHPYNQDLQYISMGGYEFDKSFSADNYEYNVEVSEDIVEISCLGDEGIKGCNEKIDLTNKNEYKHEIEVYVKGEKKVYTININKNISEEESKLRITSIEGNPLNWTNKSAVIKVNATSENGIDSYSFDGGNKWQSENTITVSENKKLQVVVKDKKGNITKAREVDISKIDKKSPTIKLEMKKGSKGQVTITITAEDDLSGLEGIDFNNSGYINKNTYIIEKAGIYFATAKDKAGNISNEAKIEVKNSDLGIEEDKKSEKTFTATFNGNGASVGKTQVSCKTTGTSCEVKAPAITRSGATVVGFSTNANSKTAEYKANSTIKLTKNTIYYAITYKKYTAKFDGNSATIKEKEKTCNAYNTETSCSIVLPSITRSGWNIVGWSSSKNGLSADNDGSKKYVVGETINISGDKTYYAVTSKQYTATFDGNGATPAYGKSSCNIYNNQTSCSVTLPSITRSGWTISGWSSMKNGVSANNDGSKKYVAGTIIDLKSDVTYYAVTSKEITVNFDSNGADSVQYSRLKCNVYNTASGCSAFPTITRSGATIIGWNTNKDATSATRTVGENLRIEDNEKTYYAITKKTIRVTFDSGIAYKECTLYNGGSCSISMPKFNKRGSFSFGWGTNQSDPSPTYLVGNSYEFKANTNLYGSIKSTYSSSNYSKTRNFTITSSYSIGAIIFEYETGIPSNIINSYNSFIQQLYKDMPHLFVPPSKVFALTNATYSSYSIAYGLTLHASGGYYSIDVKYDTGGFISTNTLAHELAHAWDYYYGYRMGTGRISTQQDFKNFYNSLKSKSRLQLSSGQPLSEVETFAGMFTNYYWHILGKDSSAKYYAMCSGCSLTSDESNQLKTIMEKYIRISNNGYK